MLSRTIGRGRVAATGALRRPNQQQVRFLTPEERLKYISTPPYVLPFPHHKKIMAPAMTYISGEEMTRYTMELIMEQWIKPHIDISKWEIFDLSCKSRDATNDKVLHDAVASGARLCSIFKEPTITPSAVQVKEMGLKKAWGSPNGAMRRGYVWGGLPPLTTLCSRSCLLFWLLSGGTASPSAATPSTSRA